MSPSDRPLAPEARAKPAEPEEYASLSSFFVRLLWVFAGPVALVGYLAWLLRSEVALAAPASLAFWGLVGLLVVARFVDVKRFRGETSTGGERATLDDAKRFAATVVGLAAAGWVGVHLT